LNIDRLINTNITF